MPSQRQSSFAIEQRLRLKVSLINRGMDVSPLTCSLDRQRTGQRTEGCHSEGVVVCNALPLWPIGTDCVVGRARA